MTKNDYLMMNLACLFQKPAYKNNIAGLIKSIKGLGLGKDLFYDRI